MLPSEDEVRKRGRNDGRGYRWLLWPFLREGDEKPYPPDEDREITEFEKDISQRGTRQINEIAHEWQQRDNAFWAECEIATANYHAARHKADDAELSLESIGPAQARRSVIAALESEIRKYALPHIPLFVAWPLLVVITFSEVWFNYQVFKILNMGPRETFGMAIGILVSFVVLPHVMGVKIRKGLKKFKDYIMVGLGGLVGLGGFWGLSILREKFIEGSGAMQLLGIHMAPGQVGNIMMGFNTVIFISIIFIAHESTMPGRVNYRSLVIERDKKIREEEVFKQSHIGAEKELFEAWIRMEKAHTNRTNAYEVMKASSEAIIDKAQSFIRCYRDLNISSRPGKKRPSCWLADNGLADIEREMRAEMPEMTGSLHGCGRCPYFVLDQKRTEDLKSRETSDGPDVDAEATEEELH